MAIEITYRRTSRLSMRIVKNGDVHVSVPIGYPSKLVDEFIADHAEWIESARKRNAEIMGVKPLVVYYKHVDDYSGIPYTGGATILHIHPQ